MNGLYNLIDNPKAEKAVTEAAVLFEKSIVVTDCHQPPCRQAAINVRFV